MQQTRWSIELEEYHGSPTNGGETNNEGIFEDKMLMPDVLTWVEQGHKSVTEGVKARQIGAFRTVHGKQAAARLSTCVCPPCFSAII
jgi:hypothetical protein